MRTLGWDRGDLVPSATLLSTSSIISIYKDPSYILIDSLTFSFYVEVRLIKVRLYHQVQNAWLRMDATIPRLRGRHRESLWPSAVRILHSRTLPYES
jgi:hypothetical protein